MLSGIKRRDKVPAYTMHEYGSHSLRPEKSLSVLRKARKMVLACESGVYEWPQATGTVEDHAIDGMLVLTVFTFPL